MKRRTLVLIRHGKAVEAEEFEGDDFDRPLLDKGEKDIEKIGKFLRLSGIRPNRIITSPAKRAHETAEVLRPLFRGEEFQVEKGIYSLISPDPKNFQKILAPLDEADETVFFIGHNPSLTQFAEFLIGTSGPPLKKGSALVLRSYEKCEWDKIAEGSMEPIYYVTPTFLREE